MSAEKLGDQKQGRRRRLPSIRRTKEDPTPTAVAERGSAKGRATPSRRRHDTPDEGNLIERTGGGLVGYVQGVRSELNKVAWPSREETQRLTIIVVATLIASALILGIISAAFTELFRIGLAAPAILFAVIAVAVIGGFIFFRVNSRRTNNY